jgi:hypothetical protein
MKKVIIYSILAVLIFSFPVLDLRADEQEGGDGDSGAGSSNLITILAAFCKQNPQYTAWSECNTRFGAHGLQYRQIVYPTANGCTPTAAQQVAQVRECPLN